MASQLIPFKNYRTSYFQYPTLDKIHGQPTLDTILHLQKQIKINAQSVPTTLGGGQLGYLALVLPRTSYDAIPNAGRFDRPTDPGPFIVQTRAPPTTRTNQATPVITAATVAQQKAEWDENKRVYNECQAVEQVLRQQIIEAIDPEYLEPLRDQYTEMVNDSIPSIFEYLLTTYGEVSDEDILDRETELKTYTYDPIKSVDDVFNKIRKHQELASLMGNPMTEKQQTTIAYAIFNKTNIFKQNLIEWNRKAANEKTLLNFTKHMRSAWNELNKVGALTIHDSSINSAHMLQDITATQEAIAEDLRQTLADQLQTSIAEAMAMFQGQQSIPPTTTTTDETTSTMNSVNSSITMDTLLQTINDLKREVLTLKSTPTTTTTNKDINPRTGRKWRRYCWTHGCCTHHGKDCKNKAEGHDDNATFRNRLGGSNKNCIG